jgi:CubicO group peptidase (beta-lactamase class C family)
LLFDKPDENTKNTPTAKSASCLTFGHTGFTGTCVWADPLNDLVFIFLSNRVNPSAANNKLAKQNIRTDIMEIFYNQFDKNSSFYIK